MHLGRSDDAIDVGQRGIEDFPRNPDVLYHTGMALLSRAENQLARQCFQRASQAQVTGYALISMSDKSIQEWRAQKMLADVDFLQGDLAQAYAGYLSCLDAIPDGTTSGMWCMHASWRPHRVFSSLTTYQSGH